MKIVIGLFQDKKDATELYRKRLHDITTLTEVGPFFSRKQALAWMRELQNKIEDCEVAFLPEKQEANKQWYGFTFEE